MVKDHSDSERGNRCRHMGYSFRLAALVILYASSNRHNNTYHGFCYTSRGALAGTRNSSSHHERTLLPRSYILLPMLRISKNNKLSVESVLDSPNWRTVTIRWQFSRWLGISSNNYVFFTIFKTKLFIDKNQSQTNDAKWGHLYYWHFSFQPVLHDWCNKGSDMCYLVYGMHVKEPLMLIGKSISCGGSGFPLSLPGWSFTICLTPYNLK